MIMFSAKKSAVHDMHLEAIKTYAASTGLAVTETVYGARAAGRMMLSRNKTMFSQSTGLASLLVIPLARLSGKNVVHYMHEPTPLRRKLQENPPIKSLIWHFVQWVEAACATKIMVSRQALLDQAAAVYRVSKAKFVIAPLLMPMNKVNSDQASPTRVTYLGRIDERRYFQEFLAQAPALAKNGFQPTILTGAPDALKQYADAITPEIDVLAEANFSEDLKSRIMAETLVLWNPKRGSIAQSGVTADAVRYGRCILLTDKDPSYQDLRDQGIAMDFYDVQSGNFKAIGDIDAKKVSEAAQGVFSVQHGSQAFRETYLPAFAEL